MATKNKQREPSAEAVLSRARRMMRKELKPLAAVLNLTEYDQGAVIKAFKEAVEAKATPSATGPEGQQAAPGPDRSEEIVELKSRIRELEKEKSTIEVAKLKAERQAIVAERSLENMKVEVELRAEAQAAGVTDTDYAIDLLKRHAKQLPETEELNPKSFFEGLKKDPSKRALFERADVAAGPTPVANEPQRQSQGQPTPGQPVKPGDQLNPKAEPAPGEQINVEALSKRDFNAHTSDKYGFRPGY
jgi:hypothetical protein